MSLFQDEHLIIDKFGGNPKQGYFAIYDGHGGRDVVEYVAQNLHVVREKNVTQNLHMLGRRESREGGDEKRGGEDRGTKKGAGSAREGGGKREGGGRRVRENVKKGLLHSQYLFPLKIHRTF